jgi:hypothetical protein
MKSHYRITVPCSDCDGTGLFSIDSNPDSREYSCWVCDKDNERQIYENTNLYASLSEVIKDYPKALDISRVSLENSKSYLKGEIK